MRNILLFALVALTAFACREETVPPITSTMDIKAKLPGSVWLSYDKLQPSGNRAVREIAFSLEAFTVRGRQYFLQTDSVLVEYCLQRPIAKWGDASFDAEAGTDCMTNEPGGKALNLKVNFLSPDSINFTTTQVDGAVATESATRL